MSALLRGPSAGPGLPAGRARGSPRAPALAASACRGLQRPDLRPARPGRGGTRRQGGSGTWRVRTLSWLSLGTERPASSPSLCCGPLLGKSALRMKPRATTSRTGNPSVFQDQEPACTLQKGRTSD